MRGFWLMLAGILGSVLLIGALGPWRMAEQMKEPEHPPGTFVMVSRWHRPDTAVIVDSNSVAAICDTVRGHLLYVTGRGGVAVVEGGCR